MKIGGLQRLTLIDWPGKLACTVFLTGCNFHCPWCYSRVCGYLRPVSQWNIGKRQEFKERKEFKIKV